MRSQDINLLISLNIVWHFVFFYYGSLFVFIITDKVRDIRGEKSEVVGVMKDKELKLEETDTSHTSWNMEDHVDCPEKFRRNSC